MLAILTSHPIQYQAPIWRALAKTTDIPFCVWFLTNHGTTSALDSEFGRRFSWDRDLVGGYPSVFLDVEPGWDLTRFRGVRLRESLTDRLRREKATALWVEGWRFSIFQQAIRQAHAAGIDVWLRGESNDLKRDAPWKSLVKRPLLARLFRAVDEFLCVGTANRRLYRSYGIEETRLHTAPYCVDNECFRELARSLRPERHRIRADWRIPEHALCVLFCAKFIPKKRPLDLVQAIMHLYTTRTTGRPTHLLFVGSGNLGDELRKACNVCFDADNVSTTMRGDATKPPASFAGFLNQSQIPAAYVAADLLVLPSDSGETWGLVTNEAMACGTPVIASNLCGCAEDLVAPLDSRLVFRCGDIEDLAAAIRHAEATQLAPERIRQIADTHHLRHTVDTVRELYARLPRN